jgi:hypothetical protein
LDGEVLLPEQSAQLTFSGVTWLYVVTVLNGALVLTTSQTHYPQVSSLQGKGVAAQAINSEALTAAALEGRDIWADSKTGKSEILLLRPETTAADAFD